MMPTKHNALIKCRDHWNWLADEADAGRIRRKEEYSDAPKEWPGCWCCSFDSQFEGDCTNCPITTWTTDSECLPPCVAADSPYRKWHVASYGEDPVPVAEFAREVAKLAQDELDKETNE